MYATDVRIGGVISLLTTYQCFIAKFDFTDTLLKKLTVENRSVNSIKIQDSVDSIERLIYSKSVGG